MAQVCELTGKKAMKGNNVSFSNKKTKRRFKANLQTKRFYLEDTGEWVTMKVSTSAIKTINKNGLSATLRKYIKKGKI